MSVRQSRATKTSNRPSNRPVHRRLRVLQLGDVAGVAEALRLAVGEQAEMLSLPMSQPGARWPARWKVFAAPLRVIAAVRTSRQIRTRRPDLVHVHWVPNALAAVLAGLPFVLHAHGDDVRDVRGWQGAVTRWLLRRARLVIYSTPDLARFVDGVWLPNPVMPLQGGGNVEARVFIASRPEESKGRGVAIAASELLGSGVAIDALAGGDLTHHDNIQPLPEMPNNRFRETLASHAVIWGQFKLGALGLTELEAMSAGRAVVCWISEDVAAAYGGDIPVVSTRDPARVAEETIRLLDDARARYKLGAAASAFVRQWHAPARVGQQLAGLYDSASAESPEDRVS
jgi:glycosyltransferase involved in cell wall biosynthesis